MKKEYCGLFAIHGHQGGAYLCLYAQQHRDQEYDGSVTCDVDTIREHNGMGSVPAVFNKRHMGKELKGRLAVVHILYSTTGGSLIRNSQPFLVRFRLLQLSVAHNGNLTNTLELRQRM
ncbi:hypothetical protein DQK91_21880 [Oceanidesulfovibrio marinus]|uniref:Glutamine amidotransferase type-2 domain-containing protein n=1 Tax=Oceanidesulfovibrio marinus TaxID=370038 RepID=A0A6P1Z9K2_9BACT|nr:class II glutamine amidotransferase [Oceanidesulfovibrio marinus]TVM29738.1 hypothetical protein DQK91_21880 [Oceanidesulfovibrio marinus]